MQEGEREVRQRAYAIWEREGQPEGRSREHWEQAVRELDAESRANPGAAAHSGDDAAARGKKAARGARDPGAGGGASRPGGKTAKSGAEKAPRGAVMKKGATKAAAAAGSGGEKIAGPAPKKPSRSQKAKRDE